MTIEIVAFDLETTGLSPLNGHRVIEIGAVRKVGNGVGETFHTLVDCERPVPMSAQRIHGITNTMLLGKPAPELAFKNFRAFIGRSVLVAHNAQFDKLFLQYEYSRHGWELSNRVECTMRLSQQKLPNLPNYRLETIARHLFGATALENRKSHRALDDARLTGQIWLALERK